MLTLQTFLVLGENKPPFKTEVLEVLNNANYSPQSDEAIIKYSKRANVAIFTRTRAEPELLGHEEGRYRRWLGYISEIWKPVVYCAAKHACPGHHASQMPCVTT